MANPNDVCVDIKQILISASVAVSNNSSSWSVSIGREPISPEKVITLYPTGGMPANPKFLMDEPSFQVRVRSSARDYLGGQDKMQEIKDVLLGLGRTSQGGTDYVGIYMTNDILFLNYDDSNRPIFVSNWRTVREPNNTSGETNRTALS